MYINFVQTKQQVELPTFFFEGTINVVNSKYFRSQKVNFIYSTEHANHWVHTDTAT